MRLRKRRKFAQQQPSIAATPEGLPEGITPPPDDGVAAATDYLWADIAEGSPLGNPREGSPLRPMPAEEAVVHQHDQAQTGLSNWQGQAAGEKQSREEANSAALDAIADQEATVATDVARLTASVEEQGEQLVEKHRRYPGVFRARGMLMTILFLAGLVVEIWVQQPLVGRVLNLDPAETLAMAVCLVGVSTGVSYLATLAWNRWAQFDGPPTMRRLYALGTVVGVVASVGFVVGVTGIRVATARAAGEHDFATGVALFAALQGGIQYLAAAHGWHAGDPGVAQLNNTRNELARQQAEQDRLAANREWLIETQEVLASFDLGDWTQRTREMIAQRYAALIVSSRGDRAYELQRQGFDDAADLVALLPLPKFVVPVDDGLDDDDDWMSGGTLRLK